jgi:hypothetical protein
MRVLQEERRLSRGRAILWGFKSRARSYGVVRSLAQTASILAIDSFRAVLTTALKICFVFPIRLVQKLVGMLKVKKTAITE